MKYLFLCFLFPSWHCEAQTADTVNGFLKKINGDDITYFSPLHQFAHVALLTRVTGTMPISWESPVYTGSRQTVTYQFLMGHSSGTSSDIRNFDLWLNGEKLFTITTPMKKKEAIVSLVKALKIQLFNLFSRITMQTEMLLEIYL